MSSSPFLARLLIRLLHSDGSVLTWIIALDDDDNDDNDDDDDNDGNNDDDDDNNKNN